jgi:hypothetical protein
MTGLIKKPTQSRVKVKAAGYPWGPGLRDQQMISIKMGTV